MAALQCATNLITGVANAWADAAPLLAVGGSAPLSQRGKDAFQEMDQVAAFKPITKWAEQVTDPKRVPELVTTAVRHALGGRPGPVYLDMPGDVLYKQVEEDEVVYPDLDPASFRPRHGGDPALVDDALRLLAQAERPLVLTGSGILWSAAEAELQQLVELAGIPFYTTPQGRGVVRRSRPSYLTARATAFREADLFVVIGTRVNYIISHLAPPRFNGDAGSSRSRQRLKSATTDGLTSESSATRCRAAQLLDAADGRRSSVSALARPLADVERKRAEAEAAMSTDQTPIHRCVYARKARLPRSRRDSGRRRARDPELRSTVDPTFVARHR
jgi:acetolactate synthase-1/2/3 large subunit